MISLHQIRKFLLTISLVIFISTTIAFSFASENSWAATSLTERISVPQIQIAAMNRTEAVTKDIEGKAQEAMGNITGNSKDQIIGKTKQFEGKARNAAEDAKEQIKLQGKAVAKNAGNAKDQIKSKAKEVEGQSRNVVEDVTDKVRDLFN